MQKFALSIILGFTACAQPDESHLKFIEGETVRSYARHAGEWRMMAAYDLSVIGSNGEYSGLTADMRAGPNEVTKVEGERTCDLYVGHTQSDYRALDLPGGDGKLMNPCGWIYAVMKKFPYSGSRETSGQHPEGGEVTVYYEDQETIGGYSYRGQGGHIVVSINGGAPLPESPDGNPSPRQEREIADEQPRAGGDDGVVASEEG